MVFDCIAYYFIITFCLTAITCFIPLLYRVMFKKGFRQQRFGCTGKVRRENVSKKAERFLLSTQFSTLTKNTYANNFLYIYKKLIAKIIIKKCRALLCLKLSRMAYSNNIVSAKKRRLKYTGSFSRFIYCTHRGVTTTKQVNDNF